MVWICGRVWGQKPAGSVTGGSFVERRTEIIFEVTDELIELSLTRTWCCEHELSTSLGEHRAETLARFANPFHQDDELARDPNFPLHELRRLFTGSIPRE
jgi:hypothetical protein